MKKEKIKGGNKSKKKEKEKEELNIPMKFGTTAEINVPKRVIDQVIGQEDAVDIVKKAAKQRRNVLLVGQPGTGKSMLAQGMAEIMPIENLEDILAYPNPFDENNPKIRVVLTYPGGIPPITVPKEKLIGQGRKIVFGEKMKKHSGIGSGGKNGISPLLLIFAVLIIGLIIIQIATSGGLKGLDNFLNGFEIEKYGTIIGALVLGGLILAAMWMFTSKIGAGMLMRGEGNTEPKLIIDNSEKRNAPFIEATGSKAGALFGDCKHDPLQCFSMAEIYIPEKTGVVSVDISQKVNEIIKSSEDIIKERGYEASYTDHLNTPLFIIGENKGIKPARVLSVNRQKCKSKLLKITTESGKQIVITSEHKVAVKKSKSEENENGSEENENGRTDKSTKSTETDKGTGIIYNKGTEIVYKEAKKLTKEDEVAVLDKTIIDECDIILTYSEKEQKNAHYYYEYLKLKKHNPKWGYKRLAKKLGILAGQTRWWHCGKSKPVSVKNVEWLKKNGLIPLKINDSKLPIIARILGTTFGDGGIFRNLNGIFLSSSEKEAVKKFGEDLIKVFGRWVEKNQMLREGGEYGHSWHLLNTNRKVVRFFQALGAPIGYKTVIKLYIPNWLVFNQNAEDEFFGSLFGGAIGIPKIHKEKNRLQTLDFGVISKKELRENRLEYLNKILGYLESRGVESTSIYEGKHSEGKIVLRLMISTKLDNVIRFFKRIKIRYCKYKKKKLERAINEFKVLKKQKFNELLNRGYGAEHAMKVLNLTPRLLYTILNCE